MSSNVSFLLDSKPNKSNHNAYHYAVSLTGSVWPHQKVEISQILKKTIIFGNLEKGVLS